MVIRIGSFVLFDYCTSREKRKIFTTLDRFNVLRDINNLLTVRYSTVLMYAKHDGKTLFAFIFFFELYKLLGGHL